MFKGLIKSTIKREINKVNIRFSNSIYKTRTEINKMLFLQILNIYFFKKDKKLEAT